MDGSLMPISTPWKPPASGRTRVFFYGRLAKRFGPHRDIGGRQIGAIIRILLLTVPGFRAEIMQGSYRVLRGARHRDDAITADMMDFTVGDDGELHIIPVAKGSGGRGIGKDILGAVLIVTAIAVTVFQPELAGVIGPAAANFLAASAFTIGMLGVSLLLGGISEAISPQPGLGSSYLLGGNLNTVPQGTPVPLVYGRARTSPIVISSSYSAEDYTTATSDYKGIGAYDNGSNGNSGALKSFDSQNPLPAGAQGIAAIGKGGGGKGGGGAQGGIEAPNTLQSKAVVRLLMAISEGVIGGLVNGGKSILFGETPLEADDGTWNFRGVAWQILNGLPSQGSIPGFASATETTAVGIQVYSATPVIQTVISSTADRARVTITIPSLFATNTQNGDTNPSSLHLQIQVRPTGGTYSTVVDDVINGKCTSAYQRSYVISLPGALSGTSAPTSWDIQMIKVTQDSAVLSTQNTLVWATYELLIARRLRIDHHATSISLQRNMVE